MLVRCLLQDKGRSCVVGDAGADVAVAPAAIAPAAAMMADG